MLPNGNSNVTDAVTMTTTSLPFSQELLKTPTEEFFEWVHDYITVLRSISIPLRKVFGYIGVNNLLYLSDATYCDRQEVLMT